MTPEHWSLEPLRLVADDLARKGYTPKGAQRRGSVAAAARIRLEAVQFAILAVKGEKR